MCAAHRCHHCANGQFEVLCQMAPLAVNRQVKRPNDETQSRRTHPGNHHHTLIVLIRVIVLNGEHDIHVTGEFICDDATTSITVITTCALTSTSNSHFN